MSVNIDRITPLPYSNEPIFETTGDELGFSWRPCDRCGSTLGGMRHEWTYALHGERHEGAICVDCLMQIEVPESDRD